MLSVTGGAWAGDADRAEKLFQRGLADMLAGRHETGCELIAQSLRIDFTPGTLFTLAECRAAQGKIATAIDHYTEFLQAWGALSPEQQEAHQERLEVSKRERKVLLERVPTMELRLPADAPAGTVVMKNGVVLDPGMLGKALRVDPGEHIFVTQAPGEPVAERRTVIAAGQHLTMTLPVDTSAPDADPRGEVAGSPSPDPSPVPVVASATDAPPLPAEPPGAPAWAHAAIGVGAAGIAVGAVTGFMVLAERRTIRDECLGHACSRTGRKAAEDAQRIGTISTVAFALGVAGLGAAAVGYWVVPPSDAQRVAVSVAPATGGVVVGASSRW